MPLTSKGEGILASMKKQYGAKRGERVFYASKNKGTISGVDSRGDAGNSRDDVDSHVKTISSKAEAIAYARGMREQGMEAVVHKVEQNVPSASRGAYASQIGGGSGAATKSIQYRVTVTAKRNDDVDSLRVCADRLDDLSRRMDSLLIRQRTGHEKSRHDGPPKKYLHQSGSDIGVITAERNGKFTAEHFSTGKKEEFGSEREAYMWVRNLEDDMWERRGD